jgi:hypothetical protein
MKPFKPLDLLEGVGVEKAMLTLQALDEALAVHLGSDTEAKVVVVSFLLGRLTRNSKVEADMVFGMIEGARVI